MEGKGTGPEAGALSSYLCTRQRISMYPSAAKPAAITSRKITAHAFRLMNPWLMASSVNPSAMVKYHQANKRALSLGAGNSL